jgi:hypothetical protein
MAVFREVAAFAAVTLFALPGRAQEGTPPTAPPPPPPAFGAGARVAAAPKPAPKKLPLFYIDLKDAPARQALEMVFFSAKVDFTIDNSVTEHLTVRTGGGTVEDFLTLASKRYPGGLTWARESDVFIVKPRPGKKNDAQDAAAEKTAGPRPSPSLAEIPRRAAGIARGEQWYAILVTGDGARADETAKVVKVGDRVPSGVPGVADLKVEKINAREVVLALPEGVLVAGQAMLTVPVKRLSSAEP